MLVHCRNGAVALLVMCEAPVRLPPALRALFGARQTTDSLGPGISAHHRLAYRRLRRLCNDAARPTTAAHHTTHRLTARATNRTAPRIATSYRRRHGRRRGRRNGRRGGWH